MIFVRHGETAHNAGLVITAASPGMPLNERGVRQARELATALAASRIDAIYTSPLLRARQTAAILGEAQGVDPVVRAELRECSVGELEGRADAAAFERLDSTWDRWYYDEDLDYALGPDGETGRAALDRVSGLVDRLAGRHGDGSVLVVGHGTVLQLALTYLSSNLTRASGHRRWIAHGGTVVVDVEAGSMTCREWSGERVPGDLTDADAPPAPA
jgi:broad specificity phosphatase PhoE